MFEFSHLSLHELEKQVSEKEKLSLVDFEYVILLASLAERFCYINTNLTLANTLSQKAIQISKTLDYKYGYAMSLIPFTHCLLHFSKTKEAQNTINECLDIFREVGFAKGEALAQIYNSIVLREFGLFLKAFSEIEKALDFFLSIGEPRGISLAYKNLGRLSFEIDDIDSAIDYSQKALSYPNPNYSNCRITNNLGYFHFKAGESEKALIFLNKGLHEAILVNDKYCVSTSLINLGNVFNAKNEKDKATNYYEHGLSLLRQFGLPSEAFSSLKNLASIQIETGKHENALSTLKKLRTVAEQTNNYYLINETNIKIASILNLLDRSQESLEILNSLSKSLEKEDNHELNYKCHKILAQIYEENQNHNEALKHYKIYSNEHEKFLNNKMTEKINRIGSKSQIDGFLSQRYLQKQKDIEIAGVYDELVEYNEKLDTAHLTISELMDKLELWKNLIPLCESCQRIEFTEENFYQVKKHLEENPYILKQNNTCSVCYSNLITNIVSPKKIYETANEIKLVENEIEILS